MVMVFRFLLLIGLMVNLVSVGIEMRYDLECMRDGGGHGGKPGIPGVRIIPRAAVAGGRSVGARGGERWIEA
jgi:hypothetical protein